MINMICDRCNEQLDQNASGGCRIKLGHIEYVFHLCETCQDTVLDDLRGDFIEDRIKVAKGRQL